MHRTPIPAPLSARLVSCALTLAVLACFAPSARAEENADPRLQVTYVGNEGFLIQGGDSKILIDAVYRDGVPGYVVIPKDRRRLMNYASPPFDGVDVILATHFHPDHFDPRAVGRHLEANPETLFVSTKQAEAKMRGLSGFDSVRPRVRGVFPEEGQRERIVRGEVVVEVLNLHHGRGGSTENLGFLVTLDGTKILHVGETEGELEDFQLNRLAEEQIDIAFLPYWHLQGDDAVRIIREAFAPRRIVAMHIPPPEDPRGYLKADGGFDAVADGIEARFPSAVVFRQEMETRELR